MKNKGLVDLIKACREVLKVSREHEYLWDDASLWQKDNYCKFIELFGGFIAQDEYFSINLTKRGDRIGIIASNFCDRELIINAKQAACRISEYKVSAENLRKSFYEGLKEPLGRYLANKYIEDKLK